MTRRWLEQRLPRPDECRRRLGLALRDRGPHPVGTIANGLSARVGRTLVRLFEDPTLWHLNRRSVAGAVATGLFVGWLPLPGQMMIAALLAAVLRVHVPLSVVMVWFTNPLTVAPLGYVAWRAGSMVLGTRGPDAADEALAHPTTSEASGRLLANFVNNWPELLSGALFCAAVSAVVGFFAVHLAWRIVTIRRWRARRTRSA